jgi:hypothetical protein
MPPAVFHLPPETHGRTVAQGPLHLWGGRDPSRAGIIQHLRTAGPARSGPMDKWDVQKYHKPTPATTFYVTIYVGQVFNVLGRVQLMPLFLLGNATPTIPYELRKHQRNLFPYGCTDTAQESGRRGSNVYELNAWLWQFGRGKPRVGGLSVADTEDRQIAVLQDGARRGHAMRTKRT